MTTRELFKRRVIELIHGLPYKQAIIKEGVISAVYYDKNGKKITKKNEIIRFFAEGRLEYVPLPITIGRVMKAIQNGGINIYCNIEVICEEWQLTNKDGTECTDDDQEDETIEKLYNLIK